jgi:hypothetical protein
MTIPPEVIYALVWSHAIIVLCGIGALLLLAFK